MTITEAQKNIDEFYDISNPTEEDTFVYIESLEFLIEKTNDPKYMMELGGLYYEMEKYDLALKYYELAALQDENRACECLGYIWYYGRTGQVDYKKAFEYFDKGRSLGNIVAAYKVADMYRNGYYVEKDLDKYKSIIEELYYKVKDEKNVFSPLPEIFTRLAKIRIQENKKEEAKKLLLIAKDMLAERISINAFFGNFTIMKWLIYDLYKVKEFDENDFDFFDLYYVLSKPNKVSFEYYDEEYTIESVKEEETLAIKYNDKWFRDIDSFMRKAELDENLLAKIYYDLENFKIIKEG